MESNYVVEVDTQMKQDNNHDKLKKYRKTGGTAAEPDTEDLEAAVEKANEQ